MGFEASEKRKGRVNLPGEKLNLRVESAIGLERKGGTEKRLVGVVICCVRDGCPLSPYQHSPTLSGLSAHPVVRPSIVVRPLGFSFHFHHKTVQFINFASLACL